MRERLYRKSLIYDLALKLFEDMIMCGKEVSVENAFKLAAEFNCFAEENGFLEVKDVD